MPFVLVDDEAFVLSDHVLRPYQIMRYDHIRSCVTTISDHALRPYQIMCYDHIRSCVTTISQQTIDMSKTYIKLRFVKSTKSNGKHLWDFG